MIPKFPGFLSGFQEFGNSRRIPVGWKRDIQRDFPAPNWRFLSGVSFQDNSIPGSDPGVSWIPSRCPGAREFLWAGTENSGGNPSWTFPPGICFQENSIPGSDPGASWIPVRSLGIWEFLRNSGGISRLESRLGMAQAPPPSLPGLGFGREKIYGKNPWKTGNWEWSET